MALIQDRTDAASREREAAMPSPQRAARRGIIAGRYMGLSESQSAMMVMVAAGAAMASATKDGAADVQWLQAIHAEASRIYIGARPASGSL
jgi:hypothetical protein